MKYTSGYPPLDFEVEYWQEPYGAPVQPSADSHWSPWSADYKTNRGDMVRRMWCSRVRSIVDRARLALIHSERWLTVFMLENLSRYNTMAHLKRHLNGYGASVQHVLSKSKHLLTADQSTGFNPFCHITTLGQMGNVV